MHKHITNCPNCGAVITGPICEYCDTRFEWARQDYVKVDGLRAENIYITNQIELRELYANALAAMRNYAYN